MTFYNVIYGNYYPREVDSMWPTRVAAEQRIAVLEKEQESQGLGSGMWEIEEFEVALTDCKHCRAGIPLLPNGKHAGEWTDPECERVAGIVS